MKNKKSVEQSREAALRKAVRTSSAIYGFLEGISQNKFGSEEAMPGIRLALAELNQRVHEFNALDNVLKTQ